MGGSHNDSFISTIKQKTTVGSSWQQLAKSREYKRRTFVAGESFHNRHTANTSPRTMEEENALKTLENKIHELKTSNHHGVHPPKRETQEEYTDLDDGTVPEFLRPHK